MNNVGCLERVAVPLPHKPTPPEATDFSGPARAFAFARGRGASEDTGTTAAAKWFIIEEPQLSSSWPLPAPWSFSRAIDASLEAVSFLPAMGPQRHYDRLTLVLRLLLPLVLELLTAPLLWGLEHPRERIPCPIISTEEGKLIIYARMPGAPP